MYQSLPSVWTYLTIFLVSLGIFHLWLVYLRPLSELAWRKIDYLWLVLSIPTIVSAAGQFRSIVASDDLARNSDRLQHTISLQITNAESIRNTLCQSDNHPDPKGCAWYDESIASMKDAGQSAIKWKDLKFPRTDLLRADFKQEADIKIDILKSIVEEASVRSQLESIVARRDDASNLPLVASLYLLPVALGLRLTKVTGEVRIARRKATLSQ
jgi:hypothetical protein